MKREPHDQGYKYLLLCKRVFVELLKSFIKQGWVDQIDESNIENIDKSYIEEDFKNRESDLVYKVKLKDREVIFYVLIELQSSVDFKMPFRLLTYMMGIWNDIIKDAGTQAKRKRFRIPAIIPIVLYNGQSPWTAVQSYREIMEGHEEFGGYVVDFKYFLIDVNRYSEEELLGLSNLIGSVLMMDQKTKAADEVINKLLNLVGVLEKLDPEEKDLFSVWASNLLGHHMDDENKKILNKTLRQVCEGDEDMVYNLQKVMKKELDQSRMEGKLEGELKGRLEGELKGRLEGKVEVAVTAFRQGLDIDFVQRLTGLDKETLIDLQKSLQH